MACRLIFGMISTRPCRLFRSALNLNVVGASVLTISAVLIVQDARPLFAQTEDVETMIRKGMDLRHQGQDAQAVPYLEKAYKLSHSPRAAAQLGLVRMALGYWADAERYLDEALDDPDNPWITKNRAILEASRARVRGFVGDLTITGEPAGADVIINGQTAGKLPLAAPVRVGKGPVEVEVRAPGYASALKSLRLAGGGRDSVSLVLQREPLTSGAAVPATVTGNTTPPPDAGPSPKTAADDHAASNPLPTTPPDADAPSSDGRTLLRPFAWATGGIAVAGLALGVVETFVAQSRLDAFNNHTAPNPADPTTTIADCTTKALTQDCKTLRDSYSSAKTFAVVGYVVGGAMAVASAALFVLSSSEVGKAGSRSAFSCAPTLTTTWLGCSVRF